MNTGFIYDVESSLFFSRFDVSFASFHPKIELRGKINKKLKIPKEFIKMYCILNTNWYVNIYSQH